MNTSTTGNGRKFVLLLDHFNTRAVMEHAHDHSHAHQLDFHSSSKKAFIIGIILNLAFLITEVIVGLWNNSMALLTDAGHNASDVASLLLSLLAFALAKKGSSDRFTYGYRKTTILAALTNAVILLIAIGVLGYESVKRLWQPQAINGSVITWVAAAGIVVNSVSAYLFYKNKEKDLNIKSAYLHLLADALVSLAVVVAGVIITYTHWYWIDAAMGLVVLLVILISTWSLLTESFKMAVDAVPEGIDLSEIKKVIKEVKNVQDVHHVHVWPISTTQNALTAHVQVEDELKKEDYAQMVKNIKHDLEHHQIHHSTIEVEYATKVCVDKNC